MHPFRQRMRMKERVTVTMDRELIIRARQLAHDRGTSLSGLVESSLQASMSPRGEPTDSFVERWAGRFAVRGDGGADPPLRALKSKYRLM